MKCCVVCSEADCFGAKWVHISAVFTGSYHSDRLPTGKRRDVGMSSRTFSTGMCLLEQQTVSENQVMILCAFHPPVGAAAMWQRLQICCALFALYSAAPPAHINRLALFPDKSAWCEAKNITQIVGHTGCQPRSIQNRSGWRPSLSPPVQLEACRNVLLSTGHKGPLRSPFRTHGSKQFLTGKKFNKKFDIKSFKPRL